jgi:hypothetical protein
MVLVLVLEHLPQILRTCFAPAFLALAGVFYSKNIALFATA